MSADDTSSAGISRPGLGEELYGRCIGLLSSLSRQDSVTGECRNEELNEELARFYIWGEGFKDGKLDVIFHASPYLRTSILKTLIAIALLLIDRASAAYSSFPNEVSSLKSSIEQAIAVLRDDDDSESEDIRDDSSSVTSSGTDTEDDVIDSLEYRLRLLMTLVPSMEQVYIVASTTPKPGAIALLATSDSSARKKWIRDFVSELQSLLLTKRRIRVRTGGKLSTRSLPTVPTPPTSPESISFWNSLRVLSTTPTAYENPGLLDEAASFLPLDRLYEEAEENEELMRAQANSLETRPVWGYQDCVIMALMRWFKSDFFLFVNDPLCSRCSAATNAQGLTPPTADETARGAAKVELYRCIEPSCGNLERFPRYSDVWQLLQTRRGRVGEWVNCFTMFCRVLGSRARWVWTSEDLVWTEVYSEHQQRWLHVDVCEGVWDRPRLYTEGWGVKIAYCIAFSVEGATDVTRRYVRDPFTHGAARTRAPEEALLWMIYEIRNLRRERLSQPDRQKLQQEDEREERELQGYRLATITQNILSMSLQKAIRERPGEQKAPASLRDGGAEWLNTGQDDRDGFN